MAKATCRLNALFIAFMCLSPVTATPITIDEFQQNHSESVAIKWNSLTPFNDIPKLLQVETRSREASFTEDQKGTQSAKNESSIALPESQSLILLGLGLAGLAALMKKKSQVRE